MPLNKITVPIDMYSTQLHGGLGSSFGIKLCHSPSSTGRAQVIAGVAPFRGRRRLQLGPVSVVGLFLPLSTASEGQGATKKQIPLPAQLPQGTVQKYLI
jgi:hypothetical protein